MATLVLNLGLKSIRSIVFDSQGKKIASASKPLSTTIRGDFITQSPKEWWEKAVELMAATLEESTVRESVECITVTASSACLIPVTKNIDPLYESIMVSDKRAIIESGYISSLSEFESVSKETGLSCDPYLMLPKILWLKNNEGKVFHETYKYLSPNDYLIAKMTGEVITDEFNAQKYHYNISSHKYPEKLLSKLEIPLDTLPHVVMPGERVGVLTSELMEKLNLLQNVEVYVSTYDAICAFIGSGPKGVGEACDVSGTVTSVRAFSEIEIVDEKNRILNTPFSKVGKNIVGGSNNLGGGLIEWVKQCYYINEKYPYEIMEMEAKKSTEGANGLIFLPYLMGERAPLWDADARGVYFGIERTHTRKDMTRAVFESTGYCSMSLIEAMEENGVTVDRIRVSGGLTRINHISQIKADITGKEVVVVDEFETTAMGAAIIVGLGNGSYSSIFEGAEICVRDRMIILPSKSNHEIYKEMYWLFNESYNNLKDLFKERTKIVKKIYMEKQEKIENL
jgi:sugar (pentulose or hexulose) kinase